MRRLELWLLVLSAGWNYGCVEKKKLFDRVHLILINNVI